MKSPEVCMVIIFNHRYDENIPKLEKIYQNRFHKIVYLVPFYNGGHKNVIPVYESSYQFPGFLIQAYEKLLRLEAEYYLFISDDLLLSPNINERNILEQLEMGGGRLLYYRYFAIK